MPFSGPIGPLPLSGAGGPVDHGVGVPVDYSAGGPVHTGAGGPVDYRDWSGQGFMSVYRPRERQRYQFCFYTFECPKGYYCANLTGDGGFCMKVGRR